MVQELCCLLVEVLVTLVQSAAVVSLLEALRAPEPSDLSPDRVPLILRLRILGFMVYLPHSYCNLGFSQSAADVSRPKFLGDHSSAFSL